MKLLLIIAVLAGLQVNSSRALCECEKLTRDGALVPMTKVVSQYLVLSRPTWKRLSVINEHSFYHCKGRVRQDIYAHNGQWYKTITTYEDNCDGGNVYGVLTNLRGKVIAHIYDGDYYCPQDWRKTA